MLQRSWSELQEWKLKIACVLRWSGSDYGDIAEIGKSKSLPLKWIREVRSPRKRSGQEVRIPREVRGQLSSAGGFGYRECCDHTKAAASNLPAAIRCGTGQCFVD